MSYLLVLTVVTYEECSEKVTQAPTLHQQMRLGAILYRLGQLAAINVHTGMIIASLQSFLMVSYPVCNSQLQNKLNQNS